MAKSAVITGVTGQDGSYLAELLLEKGYKVYGIKRRSSSNSLGCSSHLEKKIEVVEGDVLDVGSLSRLCKTARPDEFYNLASQSHVGTSFEQPIYTAQCTGMGVLNCLEAIRDSGIYTKFLQASSSEMYGGVSGKVTMNEQAPFHPRSPYGVSKVFGYWMTVNYRESYKMFTCNSICFNHESPRRGPNFVTRKITKAIACIKAKKQTCLHLGDLSTKRDWGFAPEYVEVMHKILQQDKGDDYVIGTGETHTIDEFLNEAFNYADVDVDKHVHIDQKFIRPTDVTELRADTTKARKVLGWNPKIKMKELARIMVDSDFRKQGLEVIGDGDKIIEKNFSRKWWYGD